MFLGTSRRWWIAAGLLFVAGLVLIVAEIGGTLGNVVGVLLVFASMGVFAMAPMRYGRGGRTPTTTSTTPPAPTVPPAATEPPRPRPTFEAGDPSEV